MIIEAGKRRLISYRYGWKIEIQRINQKTGEAYWSEDSPAWPGSLAQACEILLERELTDGADTHIKRLPEHLKRAAQAVHNYMRQARSTA